LIHGNSVQALTEHEIEAEIQEILEAPDCDFKAPEFPSGFKTPVDLDPMDPEVNTEALTEWVQQCQASKIEALMTIEMRMREKREAEVLATEKLIKYMAAKKQRAQNLMDKHIPVDVDSMLFQARREFIASQAREMQAQITGVPLPPGSVLSDDIFKSFLLLTQYLKQGRKFIDEMEKQGRGAATPTTSTSIATVATQTSDDIPDSAIKQSDASQPVEMGTDAGFVDGDTVYTVDLEGAKMGDPSQLMDI
jgi:hypothetical protein